jgi:hypothetical protein
MHFLLHLLDDVLIVISLFLLCVEVNDELLDLDLLPSDHFLQFFLLLFDLHDVFDILLLLGGVLGE